MWTYLVFFPILHFSNQCMWCHGVDDGFQSTEDLVFSLRQNWKALYYWWSSRRKLIDFLRKSVIWWKRKLSTRKATSSLLTRFWTKMGSYELLDDLTYHRYPTIESILSCCGNITDWLNWLFNMNTWRICTLVHSYLSPRFIKVIGSLGHET